MLFCIVFQDRLFDATSTAEGEELIHVANIFEAPHQVKCEDRDRHGAVRFPSFRFAHEMDDAGVSGIRSHEHVFSFDFSQF